MHLLGLVVEAAASGAGNAGVVVAVKVSSAQVSVCWVSSTILGVALEESALLETKGVGQVTDMLDAHFTNELCCWTSLSDTWRCLHGAENFSNWKILTYKNSVLLPFWEKLFTLDHSWNRECQKFGNNSSEVTLTYGKHCSTKAVTKDNRKKCITDKTWGTLFPGSSSSRPIQSLEGGVPPWSSGCFSAFQPPPELEDRESRRSGTLVTVEGHMKHWQDELKMQNNLLPTSWCTLWSTYRRHCKLRFHSQALKELIEDI